MTVVGTVVVCSGEVGGEEPVTSTVILAWVEVGSPVKDVQYTLGQNMLALLYIRVYRYVYVLNVYTKILISMDKYQTVQNHSI